ncbi:MAG: sodium:proton antiporter NhaD [Polyangiaceae bacterium]
MQILLILTFVIGYAAIALEHPLKVDKAASAILLGVVCWVLLVLGRASLVPEIPAEEVHSHTADGTVGFIVSELSHALGNAAQVLFFLMGAMTIVELVDAHEGFKVITDRITSRKRVTLVWIFGLVTFFLSAALDNLTTSIVMISLARKLVDDKEDRWMLGGVVIIAANAGGAWSPIGDVTTTMLWIGGQVTASGIIRHLFLPSLACLVAPLLVLSIRLKGEIAPAQPANDGDDKLEPVAPGERRVVFTLGVGALLFVPVFKTVTHLPPFMGVLFGLGVLWIVTEVMHRTKKREIKSALSVISTLQRIDIPTILFFLGILLAVDSLKVAGQLHGLAHVLDRSIGNVYVVDAAIGLLSAVVDNVPLVAASTGMYPIATPEAAQAQAEMAMYVVDGDFWQMLAFCAGTGGSVLIIGSAAGVAVMGIEKMDFVWYLRRVSLLALVGYVAGAVACWLSLRAS